MCYIAPGMPHEITGLQPTRDSIAGSSGFFRELLRADGTSVDEAYYRRYDPGDPGSCKGNDTDDLIFVTGYFGSPIIETAEEIARQEGMDLLILDQAIEKKDGRRIRRLCMMGGEHGYRNLEYEAVEELHNAACGSEASAIPPCGLVIACGDGILYDEESRDLILKHELIIAGEGMSREKLWRGALADKDTWHAFMHFGDDEKKRAAFDEYVTRQKELFEPLRKPVRKEKI